MTAAVTTTSVLCLISGEAIRRPTSIRFRAATLILATGRHVLEPIPDVGHDVGGETRPNVRSRTS